MNKSSYHEKFNIYSKRNGIIYLFFFFLDILNLITNNIKNVICKILLIFYFKKLFFHVLNNRYIIIYELYFLNKYIQIDYLFILFYFIFQEDNGFTEHDRMRTYNLGIKVFEVLI